jgi:hypothetical protein
MPDEQKKAPDWDELKRVWKDAAARIAKGAAEAGRAALDASEATLKASASEGKDLSKDVAGAAL